MQKHVKQLLLLVCMLLTVSSYGQTSEVYSYVCSSKVDTGTGEKKLLNGVSHFYCRFDSNKGICYETNSAGKLKSEIYKRTSAEGYIYIGSTKKKMALMSIEDIMIMDTECLRNLFISPVTIQG